MGGADGVLTDILALVFSMVNQFVFRSFNSLNGPVAAIWQLCFSVFIALNGYRLLISGRFDLHALATGFVRILLVFVLATSWPAFSLTVFDIVMNTPDQLGGQLMASAFVATGGVAPPDTADAASRALQLFYDRGMMASAEGSDRGQGIVGGLIFGFYGLIVMLGTIALAGAALLLIVISAFATAILLGLAPVFFLMLIFGASGGLFQGWLRQIFTYGLIPLFVYAVLALILRVMEGPVDGMLNEAGSGRETLPFLSAFILVALIGVVFLSQVFQLAAGIGGGIALSSENIARRAQKWGARPVRMASRPAARAAAYTAAKTPDLTRRLKAMRRQSGANTADQLRLPYRGGK